MEAPEGEEWDKKLKRIFEVKWPKFPKLHDKYQSLKIHTQTHCNQTTESQIQRKNPESSKKEVIPHVKRKPQ